MWDLVPTAYTSRRLDRTDVAGWVEFVAVPCSGGRSSRFILSRTFVEPFPGFGVSHNLVTTIFTILIVFMIHCYMYSPSILTSVRCVLFTLWG